MSDKEQPDLSIVCGAQSWPYLHILGDNNAGGAERLAGPLTTQEEQNGALTGILVEVWKRK